MSWAGKKLTRKGFLYAIIAILHIPLLLIIYVIQPFVKIRFGYFNTDRIGHFALDLGHAIIINNSKPKNEINLYYLQDKMCNKQLEVIAKRELNISQYYRFFCYAYVLLGLRKRIVMPHRHLTGSRDTMGLTYNSKYNITLLTSENKEAEQYMKKYGWTQGEKFICINARDGAFFKEPKISRHTYRNSNIEDFEVMANYLLDLGYWVVRMGKEVEKPINIKNNKLIDYGVDDNRSDLLDVWFCKNCEFIVSTGTGVDSVAMMFKKKIVFVNYLPINHIISWTENITVPKRLFWDKSGKELSLSESLDHDLLTDDFNHKGVSVVDLSPGEIKSVVQEMIMQLNGIPLTSQQIKSQKKFWDIMESHDSYRKFHHSVRDPNVLLGNSFIESYPNFLS